MFRLLAEMNPETLKGETEVELFDAVIIHKEGDPYDGEKGRAVSQRKIAGVVDWQVNFYDNGFKAHGYYREDELEVVEKYKNT